MRPRRPCRRRSRRTGRPIPVPTGVPRDCPVRRTPNRPSDPPASPPPPGGTARATVRALTSRRVAALPILNRFLQRLRLDEFLRDHLPREDRRSRVPTATGLLVLVQNLLLSREPLYGVGEGAARHDPALLGLTPLVSTLRRVEVLLVALRSAGPTA